MSSDSGSSISDAKAASTSTFETSLVFNAAVFAAELAAFTILRPQFRLIYEPRSVLPIESKRQEELSANIFSWPLALYRADYTQIKRVNGMDAYFFVRFLRMIVRIFIPIWLISWLVLLPVTSVNSHVEGNAGLDIFTFGNVAGDKQGRYAAHLLLAFGFTAWVWYNIKYEMGHFVSSRQHHLIDPAHSKTAQASTVLITGIPSKYLSEKALFSLFSYLPGGVRQVWLNRDLKDLPDVYSVNQKARKKLESAETQLMNTAATLRNKRLKADAQAAKKAGGDGAAAQKDARTNLSTDGTRPLTAPSIVDADADPERDLTLAEKLVPKNKRPTHRLHPFTWLPFGIPFMGEQVDSIDWARDEIVRTNTELKAGRVQWREDVGTADASADDVYKPLNSAFVLFNQQIAAHLAVQGLTHNEPYRMADKFIEVAPGDVIWANLGLNPYESKIRMVISYAVTGGLIIAWAFPVAFVGAVSNVYQLCTTYKWLAWLCNLPRPVLGIIAGILPPVLLSVLMLLLPIVLRLLARFEGIPSRSGLELSLMTRYFTFSVIHSFLIVTLSSGIIAALPQLVSNPESIPSLLAQNLPQASNFFLTYVILQGFSGAASGFLQAIPLLLYYVKLFILGSTPRSVYKIKFGPRTVSWGTLFPSITLLVVIGFAYMIIAPIINGLICVSFFLFYMLYKYLFLWTLQMPAARDTGGLFFPKAIQHMFIGLYIMQICLCALFFLARDNNHHASAIAEGALMVVLIVFTGLYHLMINNSYGPLIHSLPLTLADKTYGVRHEDDVEASEPLMAPTEDEHDHDRKVANGKNDGVRSSEAGSEAGADENSAKFPHRTGKRGRGALSDGRLSTVTDLPDSAHATGVANPAVAASPMRKDFARRRSATAVSDTDAGAAQDGEESDGNISEHGTASSVRDEFAGAGGGSAPAADNGPTDFTHPAMRDRTYIVWLPQDTLGLADAEAAAIAARGIEVATVGATMDGKGHVQISMAPPDQARFDDDS